MAADYDPKGFRPGMRSLRSIKMHWNCGDFMHMDSQYEFNIKSQKKVFYVELADLKC